MIMVEFDRSQQPHRPGGHYSHQPHRGSPHLQHLDHPSARSTPSPPYHYAPLSHMAPQQQPQPAPAIRSTPTSYPSPASYPSPSMSAYQYPSQPPQPISRGSPYAQPATINLPPIRLNPPVVPQLQPPPQMHEGSPVLGSPLQPPYYAHNGLPPPAIPHHQITSSPITQTLRYPIPNAERIMSGGRHKKEIKRRTKTGCLTCRKRRIKCDEGHPTCKNCQKSKRDCLGYDPIFKAQPGPTAIQPAPAGVVGSQGYSQTVSTASSPASSCDTYEYPQIDPALDATSHPHSSAVSLLEPQATYRPELKRTIDRTSPFSSASENTRTPYTPIPRSSTPSFIRQQDTQGGNPAKRIKIDDLLSVGSLAGTTSQPLSPPSSELAASVASTSVETTKAIYTTRYAPALDDFLETGWFSSRGLQKMRSDVHLAEVMAEVFDRLKMRRGSYVEEEDPSIRRTGMDSDILWAAVKMCYGTKIPAADNRREEEISGDAGNDEEGVEALRRINIVESLVTGNPMEPIPLSPKSRPGEVPGTPRSGSQFWRILGQLASLRKDDARYEWDAHDLLEACRRHTGNFESRLLLVWIAEWQHLRGENSKQHRDQVRSSIESKAKSRAAPIDSLSRRIAGRAMGLWGEPYTEAPFCVSDV